MGHLHFKVKTSFDKTGCGDFQSFDCKKNLKKYFVQNNLSCKFDIQLNGFDHFAGTPDQTLHFKICINQGFTQQMLYIYVYQVLRHSSKIAFYLNTLDLETRECAWRAD